MAYTDHTFFSFENSPQKSGHDNVSSSQDRQAQMRHAAKETKVCNIAKPPWIFTHSSTIFLKSQALLN